MTFTKKIGIWLDHSTAYLTEFTSTTPFTEIVMNEFTHQSKINTLRKSEQTMHQKEQHEQHEFYHAIKNKLTHFTDIFITGPTNAKAELVNYLKEDHHFDAINIPTKPADKMTIQEQQKFIHEYFHQHSNGAPVEPITP